MSAVQTARLLRALQGAGAHGIDRTQFSAPNVIDGGKPIVNIPGRIQDLEAAGHRIDVVGRRNKCNVYVLATHGAATGNRVTPTAPAAPLQSTPAEILADLELRIYHVCDSCAYAWRGPFWIEGCPSCKSPAWWVASHYTRDAAQTHVPLTPPEQKVAA